eukprot:gene5364-3859_t
MQSGYVQNSAMPAYTGVSPRVTAANYEAHRGEFVSIIFELDEGESKCGVTHQVLALVGVPKDVEVSRITEFICYVHPATGELMYYQHAMLDDEFDFDVYRRFLKVSANFPTHVLDLFFLFINRSLSLLLLLTSEASAQNPLHLTPAHPCLTRPRRFGCHLMVSNTQREGSPTHSLLGAPTTNSIELLSVPFLPSLYGASVFLFFLGSIISTVLFDKKIRG